jgi:hypothetical protein
MTIYIVSGSKIDDKGQAHTVAEPARSRTRAEWIGASYVEHGYAVTIEEVENDSHP